MSKKTNIENVELTNIDETTKEKIVANNKYIVVHPFLDLEDDSYEYELDSKYPRENMSDEKKEVALSKKRINQLTTKNNKIGEILIVKSEN